MRDSERVREVLNQFEQAGLDVEEATAALVALINEARVYELERLRDAVERDGYTVWAGEEHPGDFGDAAWREFLEERLSCLASGAEPEPEPVIPSVATGPASGGVGDAFGTLDVAR